jgi:hypothetical protein
MANPSQVANIPGGSTSTDPYEASPVRSSSAFARETPTSSQDEGSLASELKETARTATDAIRQQAAQFAQDAGHELGKTGEFQKARGVDALRRFARAIDSAAGELEGQSPTIAQSVHAAARKVDGFSDNLSNRDVNELIDSATQLARAQPVLFVGGSIAAGFALARFLMSSARQRSGGRAGAMNTSFEP